MIYQFIICLDLTHFAWKFAEAPPEQQRKMQLLLNLRLRDLTPVPRKPLKTVMDEIGPAPRPRGLTPEILDTSLSRTVS